MTPRNADDEFSVGAWRAYPKENRLVWGDRVESIEPRVMSVLVCLSATPGKIVSADRLLDEVWMGRAHGDHTVYQAIADLRKALGDNASQPRFIETIPKRGYRLIAKVSAISADKMNDQHGAFLRSWPRMAVSLAAIVLLAAMTYVASNGQPRTSLSFASVDSDRRSIAVLPFVNMNDEAENDLFSDGLSEDILSQLSRIPELKVIGRTSSFSFKNNNEDIRVIGEILGVTTILEGSVRRSGDQVRITVQLVDALDGTSLWSETYDRTVTDIFAVQDDVAAAIVDALQLEVGMVPARKRPTENWQAYTLFLEAKTSIHIDKQNAERILLRATELDASFAEAWELLSFVYFRQAGDSIEAVQGQKLTGDAAARALASDPDLVLARAMFEAGNLESWSLAKEIAAFERALQERPNSMELLHALRYDLFQAGYHEEALNIAERMVEIDPLASNATDFLITSLYAVGRTDEAIALLESQDRLGVTQAKWDLGAIYVVAGQDDVAFSYFEAHEQQTGYSDPAWVQDWVTHARDPVTGQAFLDQSIEEEFASLLEEYVHSWRLGSSEWYLYLGYLERYFELVFAENPTASNWTDVEWLINAGMMFRQQGFTAHPKFLELAEAVGITDVWEQRGPPAFCKKADSRWTCD
jgi:TolB-like protein/DNA-binding winged helix-turn-helix (wHTH) protein